MTKLDIVKGLVEQMREPKKLYYIWNKEGRKEAVEAHSDEHWSSPHEEWENNYTPTRFYEELKEVRRLLVDIEKEWGFNR